MRKPSTSTDPSIVAAEKLWTAAANESNLRVAVSLWEKAADAFVAIAEAGKVTKAEQTEAVYAAMLAMKNALNVDPRVKQQTNDKEVDYTKPPTPNPIPEREQRLIKLFIMYEKIDATSDEAIGVKFLHANILRRYNHLDEADAMFRDLLEHHRSHEVAEYAANLLLDSLNRQQKYDELVALADQLRADKAFLADKAELAATLAKIHATRMRRDADKLIQDANKTHVRADYDRCGEAYLAIVAESKRGQDSEESLYNAMVCFEDAGSVERARAAGAQLVKLRGNPNLRRAALGRLMKLEGGVARYAEAAKLGEQYITEFPAEKDALDAASDALYFRLALADVDGAVRLLTPIAKLVAARRFGSRDRHIVADAKVQVARLLLAVGRRGQATDLVRSIPFHGWGETGVVPAMIVFRDAACPGGLVDELCLHRDAAIAKRMHQELERASATDESAFIRRMLLDLDLERVLDGRRDAKADVVQIEYTRLAESKEPYVRAAAHARLALLARRAKQKSAERDELDACIAEAQAPWFASCERDRDKLEPRPDRVRERLPPGSTAPVIATETLR